MLKNTTNLNPNIFNDKPELFSMRSGVGESLCLLAQSNDRIVVICADLTESTGLLPFKNKFPDRFIQVGVAEQNLATIASGMAAMGKIPFIASYAIFSPGRNWEQIRTTICYNNLPVKIIGTHAGLNVGPDGGSHQALEDIALMRVIPRMTVISPCDLLETMKAIVAVSKTDDPTYIRLPREKSPLITNDDTPFIVGRTHIVYESHPDSKHSVGIIATGPILYQSILAAKKLSSEGKRVKVMNLSTIKPLNHDAIIRFAHETKALVTVEEHQISGGMGSAIAECVSAHFPIPIEFVGVKDRFGQSGQAEDLMDAYNLQEKDIHKAVHRVLLRK
jgi:transketolase